MKETSIDDAFEVVLRDIDLTIKAYHWEDPDRYAAWLAQQYFLVRHSTRLLCLAASKITDPVTHREFLRHLEEEKGHDELLLRDLEGLGRSIHDYIEHRPARCLIHNQYYWLSFGLATSIFGYSQYLEGISIYSVPQVIERLKRDHRFKNSLRFLTVHATSDESHYPDGLRRMSLLSQDEKSMILSNLEESHHLYKSMFEELGADSPAAHKRTA